MPKAQRVLSFVLRDQRSRGREHLNRCHRVPRLQPHGHDLLRPNVETIFGFAGIAGSAYARHHLATPRAGPCLHAQTSQLRMHVKCKLTATHFERDCASRNCFQRKRRSRVE